MNTEEVHETSALVYWNGHLVAKDGSVSVSRKLSAVPVKTTERGVVGCSWQLSTSVDIGSATVLSDDLARCLLAGDGQITVVAGGKTIESNGYLPSFSVRLGDDGGRKFGMQFVGAGADWN